MAISSAILPTGVFMTAGGDARCFCAPAKFSAWSPPIRRWLKWHAAKRRCIRWCYSALLINHPKIRGPAACSRARLTNYSARCAVERARHRALAIRNVQSYSNPRVHPEFARRHADNRREPVPLRRDVYLASSGRGVVGTLGQRTHAVAWLHSARINPFVPADTILE